ncbi:hypothetical protein sscle_05g048250 [Sclerotinia sclerotiorum 1980 UF-70]|uniref:Uncharacterized protein n=1 Tax=Sclerotinia sclerotiorum (strain ATCC 18683 / 1980 / Ss-1) TaxID=665079 RepID=A0A1D9Q542_SCLS1|nr:hypothetical protein sscle_05g048250 [Sclerotinia sclerotiorum 1980 UF-70]
MLKHCKAIRETFHGKEAFLKVNDHCKLCGDTHLDYEGSISDEDANDTPDKNDEPATKEGHNKKSKKTKKEAAANTERCSGVENKLVAKKRRRRPNSAGRSGVLLVVAFCI